MESVSAERDAEQDRDRKAGEQRWKGTKCIYSSAALRYTRYTSQGNTVVFTPPRGNLYNMKHCYRLGSQQFPKLGPPHQESTLKCCLYITAIHQYILYISQNILYQGQSALSRCPISTPTSSCFSQSVVEEVFRSFPEVKVLISDCKNTLLQVKVLHRKCNLSKSM